MKSNLLVLMMVLAANFGWISATTAQVPNTGVGTTGLFGYRVIGGPSYGVATTGLFGDRFVGPQVNSSYNDLQVRTGTFAPNSFYRGQMPYSTFSPSPFNAAYSLGQNNVTNLNNLTEQPVLPEMPAQPLPPGAMEGTAPFEQNPPLPPGMEPAAAANPAVANPPTAAPAAGTPGATNQPAANPAAATVAPPTVPYPRGWAFTPSRVAISAPSLIRSAELSNRMTQIAREKGMLAGPRIDVSWYGGVAVLQGIVHNSGERSLLANVLSLEPRVGQIDNRLVTERNAATTPSALKNR